MNRTVMVVDDLTDLLALYEGLCLTAPDAEVATDLINSGQIKRVYCDFHGITMNRHDARTVLDLCRAKGIAYFSTTTDDRAIDDWGVETVPKTQAMKELK